MTATLNLDTDITYTTISDDGDTAMYDITTSDGRMTGTIMAQPARFGMHPDLGVLITFGGYYDTIDIDDCAVRGSVVCYGHDMRPGPAPRSSQYPIGQLRIIDPDTADYLTALASAVACHYTADYAGHGLR